MQYGFDGLDLDYEFPDASDKNDFALWVKEIKIEFQPYDLEVIRLSLSPCQNFHFNFSCIKVTAAISASVSKIENGLDIPILNDCLDAFYIMAYDLHGTWDSPKKVDHHAPLFARNWDANPPLTANAA